MTNSVRRPRQCIMCGATITACNGACVTRDVLACMHGLTNEIREVCGACWGTFDWEKELGDSVAGTNMTLQELFDYDDAHPPRKL